MRTPTDQGCFVSYLSKYMVPGERLITTFPLSHWVWWRAVAMLVLGGGLSVICVDVGMLIVAAVMLTITMLGILHQGLVIMSIEQGVTTRRVLCKTGALRRRSMELFLDSIETVDLVQTLPGRLFDYGAVEVTGRGQAVLLMELLKDPMKAKQAIEAAYANRVSTVQVAPAVPGA